MKFNSTCIALSCSLMSANLVASTLTQFDVLYRFAGEMTEQGFDLSPAHLYFAGMMTVAYPNDVFSDCGESGPYRICREIKSDSSAMQPTTDLKEYGNHLLSQTKDNIDKTAVYSALGLLDSKGELYTTYELASSLLKDENLRKLGISQRLVSVGELVDVYALVDVVYNPEFKVPSTLSSLGFNLHVSDQLAYYEMEIGEIYRIDYQLNFDEKTITIVQVNAFEGPSPTANLNMDANALDTLKHSFVELNDETVSKTVTAIHDIRKSNDFSEIQEMLDAQLYLEAGQELKKIETLRVVQNFDKHQSLIFLALSGLSQQILDSQETYKTLNMEREFFEAKRIAINVSPLPPTFERLVDYAENRISAINIGSLKTMRWSDVQSGYTIYPVVVPNQEHLLVIDRRNKQFKLANTLERFEKSGKLKSLVTDLHDRHPVTLTESKVNLIKKAVAGGI
ncbi:hypothetical protein SAMN04488136_13034 [Vibrio xiamenensis]|uniref:Uncharacterized protein n=1 Tax=Vibrio xiamenensis TaxID=861298 RepID=A0A1G8FFL8_9VIBR|nr:hypothetical protein [Vibrio xiamenensis]SDH80832.1 hypothetical protein SAMN04488136_13034 [Vibrio xiamenensis]